MSRWSKFVKAVKESWATSGGMDTVSGMTYLEILQDKEDIRYSQAIDHTARLNYIGWINMDIWVFNPALDMVPYGVYNEATAHYRNKVWSDLVRARFRELIHNHKPKKKTNELY